MPKDPASGREPGRSISPEQYSARAPRYDTELLMFEPIRAHAIALLGLLPGQQVLDVGCGTGLSFDGLRGRVGPRGRIVGIEPCAEMLARAEARVAARHWGNVDLVQASAEQAEFAGKADAALFHFTHDVLRHEPSLDNVLAHLKPGARVVAVGLQWAPPWAWAVNGFVTLAALYSVSHLDGLGRPWELLAARLDDLKVEQTMFGGVYLARGTYERARSTKTRS
jgi:SAM-dependent methyltransferase